MKNYKKIKKFSKKIVKFSFAFLMVFSVIYSPTLPVNNNNKALAAVTDSVMVLNYNQTILEEGTSWIVPWDWVNGTNTIEVIGGGGSGWSDVVGTNGKGGGGGGAYNKITNLTLTPGTVVTYQIGVGGKNSNTGTIGGAPNGSDTFFNRTAGSAGTCVDTTSVCAKGGLGATTATGATGGLASASYPTTPNAYNGGTGGTGNTTGDTGGGGGGAGGAGFAGMNGGAGNAVAAGGGGGGGGGGSSTSTNGVAGSTTGGNGGVGSGSAAGGTGGSSASGTNGTANGAGGGGGDSGTNLSGAHGANGVNLSGGVGPGGGGGGAASNAVATGGHFGGNGGLYGAGGGGGRYGGRGSRGVIVITYGGSTASKISWTVPEDWNSASNSIKVIGAGGAGFSQIQSASSGSKGGGGGAANTITNLSLTPKAVITYQIGARGRKNTIGTGAGANGGDTFFNRTSGSAGTCADTTSICAKGGGGGTSVTAGGAGGLASASYPATNAFNGGNGGAGNSIDTSGGGGGAGGFTVAGKVGGAGGTSNNSGGGGGGGAGGASSANGVAGAANGSAGGAGPAGTGAGGGGNTTYGANAAVGLGGGGGGGDNPFSGGAGGSGSSTTYGGGGGGGAGDNNYPTNTGSPAGGDGGLFGGGAGGGMITGFGANGVIVVTYTPYCMAVATGNWSDTTIWRHCGGVDSGAIPTAADTNVVIRTGTTVTLTAATASIGNLIVNGTLNTGTNFAINASTIDVNASGTLTANNSQINLSGTTGTLFIEDGTFNAGGSTVNILGNGTPTIVSGAPTFYNLTLNSTGIKSLGENLTVGGALTITAGTLDTGATFNLAVTGATSVTGVLSQTGSGTKTYTGLVTVNSGGSITSAGAGALTFNGGLTVASGGTFTDIGNANVSLGGSATNNSGSSFDFTGTVIFTASASLLGGGGFIFRGAVTLNSNVVLTNTNTVWFESTLNGVNAGSSYVNNNTTYFKNTTNLMATGTLVPAATANSIIYSGVSPTCKTPTTNNYYNLSFQGTSGVVTCGVTAVTGNVTSSGGETWTPVLTSIGGILTLGGTAAITTGASLVVTGLTTVGSGTTLTQGTTFNFTTGGLTVAATGKFKNIGTGNITLNGNVSNASTATGGGIEINTNGGAQCTGDADTITISSGTTPRTWAGAGTFILEDVTMSYQDAGVNITLYSSTNAGNNASGAGAWTWGVCQSPPTVALNTPANAGTVSTGTPTLNFTGTDINSDNIEYNVQVDTANTFDSTGQDIAFSSASAQRADTSSTTITYSFTNNATSGVVVIGIQYSNNMDGSAVTGITYGGVAMTWAQSNTTVGDPVSRELFYLLNPPTGANNVVITIIGASTTVTSAVASYSNVATIGATNQSGVNPGTALAVSDTSTIDRSWHIGMGTAGYGASSLAAGSGTTMRTTSSTYVGIMDSGVITPAGSNTLNLTSASMVETWTAMILQPGGVSSYYFDASDAAATDSNAIWSSDANAFDSDAIPSTSASIAASITGSTSAGYLMAEGTNTPISGGTITQVRARMYAGGNGPVTSGITGHAAIYTNSLGALLGTVNATIDGTPGANVWSSYTTLSAPSGGWTWQGLNNLETKVYGYTSTSQSLNVFKVELEVTYSNSPLLNKFSIDGSGDFTAGHPFASGVAKDYTVQAGDTLANGTYYWRVAGIDPGGNNAYGAWSSTRSFTISSAHTTTIGTTGTQTSSLTIPSTNQFVGGAFTLTRDSGSANVTSMTVTVNSATGLSNMKLYTDTVASCTTANPVASATLFGTTATVGATTTITGSAAVTSTPRCMYVVVDVGSGAADAQTLDVSIASIANVTVSTDTISGTPAIAGATTLNLPGVVISGTIYSNETPTAYNCSTGNVTVRVAKNGVLAQSVVCSAVGGTYTLLGITGVVAGDVLTVFVDSATTSKQGVVVTKANDGTTPITINLYQQRVIVRNENGVATTNANMSQYCGSGCTGNNANIPFTYSTGNITISALNKLIVWTGKTFTPGGNVTTTPSSVAANPDGDVTIQSGATLSMGTNAFSVGGDFLNQGTFSYGAGQVMIFTATGTGFTVEDGTNNFDTLVFNGAGGGWSLGSAVTTVGNLTITAGNLTMPAFAYTIGGATSVTGTLTISSATGAKAFTGNVTVNASGTWNNSGNAAIGLSGNLTNNQTFTAGSGLYTMSGTSKTIAGTIAIPSLTISGTTQNNGTLTVATALAGASTLTNGATGTLNIGQATVPLSSGTLTTTASGNIVNYTAAAPNCKVVAYHHLNFTGSGAVTCAITTVAGNLGMSGTTTWSTGSSINVAGTFTNNSSGAITNNNTFTATTGLAGSSSFINAATGTLRIGFATAPAITTLTATASGNIVDYDAAAPNCKVVPYYILNFTGSGAVTCAVTTIGGNLTLAGTVTWSTTSSINVAGTFTNVSSGAITNNNTFTATTGLSGDGNFINGATGILNIGFSTEPTITNLYAFTSGNTVNYTAAVPNCKVTQYYHLNFTGSGAVTCAVTDITGNLGLSGTVAWTTTSSINVAGTTTVGTGTTLTNANTFTFISPTIAITSTGGMTNNGTTTISTGLSGTGSFTNGAAGTLNIGFATAPAITTLTTTASGNTVFYTAAVPNCRVVPYYNLYFTGSGAITCAVTTVNGNLADFASGVMTWTTSGALNVGGNLIVSNLMTLTQGAFPITVAGDMTVGSGGAGTFIGSGLALNLNGNLTLATGSTWTKGAGTVTFGRGSAQVITDNTASKKDLGIVATANAGTSVSTATNTKLTLLNIAPSTTFDISGDTLTLTGSGTPLSVSGTFTQTGSTVNYSSVSSPSIANVTYNNLTISGTISAVSASATVGGLMTVSGTFSPNAGTMTLNGGLTNNGTITASGTNTFVFATSGAAAIGGTASATQFQNFSVSAIGAAKTLTFKHQTTNAPIFTFNGTVTLTGASAQLITINSDDGTNQWLAHFVVAGNPTYVSVSNSGCDAGTLDMTVDNTSTLGLNNGSCWKLAAITTLGNGTDGSSSTIAPGAGATEIDRFSLVTNTGTDTVTGMTVTLAPAGAFNNIATVDVQTVGSVSKCSLTPSSNTVLLTTCGISVNTTPTEYKILITPKTHANMGAVPGASYATTATVTSITVTNTIAGTDSSSVTITVDNASPGGVTSPSGSAGNTVVNLAWLNPSDADFITGGSVVILRHTGSAVTTVPVEGATYVAGNVIASTDTVVCVIASNSASGKNCQDSGLTNGTDYYYKIFTKDIRGNYNAGNVIVQNPVRPINFGGGGGGGVSGGGNAVGGGGQSGGIVSGDGGSGGGGGVLPQAFAGVDGTTLTGYDSSWTLLNGNFGINTNSIFSNTAATDTMARWTSGTFNDNQYAEMALTVLSSGNYIGVAVRTQAGAQSGYGAYSDSNTNAKIVKWVTGTPTDLYTGAVFAPGDVMRLEISGTGLTLKKNGTTITSTTDATLTTGRPGIVGKGNSLSSRGDNFYAGSIVTQGGGGGGGDAP